MYKLCTLHSHCSMSVINFVIFISDFFQHLSIEHLLRMLVKLHRHVYLSKNAKHNLDTPLKGISYYQKNNTESADFFYFPDKIFT
jgi:hypothetical protein